jgi:hypothetical protein
VDRYRDSSQAVAKPRLVDLPHPFPDRYRVVLGHYAFRLRTEYPVQVAFFLAIAFNSTS